MPLPAGLANLAEGIRADMMWKNVRITVTTIYPGYIRTELNIGANICRLKVPKKGVEAIVEGLKPKVNEAFVPAWPWLPIGIGMKILLLRVMDQIFISAF